MTKSDVSIMATEKFICIQLHDQTCDASIMASEKFISILYNGRILSTYIVDQW